MTACFEVYTYFGRVISTFGINENATHHGALEKARSYLVTMEAQGTTCWIRYSENGMAWYGCY